MKGPSWFPMPPFLDVQNDYVIDQILAVDLLGKDGGGLK